MGEQPAEVVGSPAWWQQLLDLFASMFGRTPARATARRRVATRAADGDAPLRPMLGTPVFVGPPLPCDLFLLTGTALVPLFSAGPTDPLAFFQRRGVGEEHDVEFIVRREGDEPLPWAVLRLRPDLAVTLPDPQRAESFWRDLYRTTGLAALPKAGTITRGLDPLGPGTNVFACAKPEVVFKTVTGRRYTHEEALGFVRASLRGVHLISWLEDAFPRRLPPGEVVHRYYVDRGHVYVVRHHWVQGKTLYLAQPSAEALPLMASQAIRRAA